jgi:3-oxoacyl-[acyl-carrier-protein] synthase II
VSANGLVVTGTGIVCPLGSDPASVAAELRGGRCATRVESDFAKNLPMNIARRQDRLSKLILVAAIAAAERARLREVAGERTGLVVGTGLGCLEKTEGYLEGFARAGLAHADAMSFPESMDSSPAAHVSIVLGCRGPSMTVSQREISGECAIVLAAHHLEWGLADAVIVAAGDTTSPELVRALARLAPGVTPGEGAAAIVLETSKSAERRGAQPLARLLGWASKAAERRTSVTHLAPPDVEAKAVAAATRMATDEAEARAIVAAARTATTAETGTSADTARGRTTSDAVKAFLPGLQTGSAAGGAGVPDAREGKSAPTNGAERSARAGDVPGSAGSGPTVPGYTDDPGACPYDRETLTKRMGWIMGSGVLRTVLALQALPMNEGRPAVISGRARGGTAAALIFGPA